MARRDDTKIRAFCTDENAEITLSFDVEVITKELMTQLEKCLGKKGIALEWIDDPHEAELVVEIVTMNQGNQLLRWLVPFVAPAILEVEGEIALEHCTPVEFQYDQRAHIGVFGGTGKGMLKVNAQRVAAKIAKDVLRQLG
jgi:hypothetical protein